MTVSLFSSPQVSSPSTLLFDLISFTISSLLIAALIRMAIKQVRGQQISIGDIFNVGDVALQVIIASFLTSIVIAIGIMLCIIPGLVATGLLLPTIPLIVDKQLGGLEAISTSINTLKSQWLMAAIFSFILGIIYMVGVLACGVGLLIAAPVAVLSIAILYRNFFIGPGSSPASGEKYQPAIPPGS